MAPLRFGIMGCANIARKNARAIYLSGNCTLVAVASRSLEKAKAFAAEVSYDGRDVKEGNGASAVRSYGSYEELLDDAELDAVYIPLPTTQHLEWVTKAAKAKKHILIEKPVAVTMEELDLMIAVCLENQVVLMDGLMFQHHERLTRLVSELNDPFTGPVSRIHSSFSFRGDDAFLKTNIRTSEQCDPLGALGDLGWYNVRLSLIAMNASNFGPDGILQGSLSLPVKISGVCSQWAGENQRVPIDCRCVLEWENPRRVATFDCSFLTAFRQHFEIVCNGSRERGSCDKIFTCTDFVIPASPTACSLSLETIPAGFPGVDNALRIITQKDTIEIRGCQQEVKMFEAFASLTHFYAYGTEISTALKAACRAESWLQWTRANQLIVNALMQSMLCGGAEVVLSPRDMSFFLAPEAKFEP